MTTTVQAREATVARTENPLRRSVKSLVWLASTVGVAAGTAYVSSDIRPVRIGVFGVVALASVGALIHGAIHATRRRNGSQ